LKEVMMRVRLIVADQGEARFYDLDGIDSRLRTAGKLLDPQSLPREGEFAERQPSASRTPGPSEPRPRKDAAMRFARQIGAELETARRSGGFDRIVLLAGPAFIGLLRSALPDGVRATLIAEVRKDLLGQEETIIQAYVPPEAFE
jgi:protein required for attachment to host cells